MTQIPTSPPGFDGATPPPPYPLEPIRAKSWSAAAITGFVLSLLGCGGITALLGLAFGIMGIVKTKDGQRRGLGFAVAAIPISLITGALFLRALPGAVVVARLGPKMMQLAQALESSDATGTVAAIRSLSTDSFNGAVSDEDLNGWLEHIRSTHGKLVDLERPSTPATQTANGGIRFSTQAKFVNGRASITIEVIRRGLLDVKVNDFAVDGVSPRETD
jgi:hypothetical protein